MMSRRSGLMVAVAVCGLGLFFLTRSHRGEPAEMEPAAVGSGGSAVGRPDLEISNARALVETALPFPLVETYLAVNPLDAGNLVGSAMSTEGTRSVLYRTEDAGVTWHSVEGPAGVVFEGGDPMLAFARDGSAYFSTITPEIRVWRSADGGRTWADPVTVGQGNRADRQWLVASPSVEDGPPTLHAAAKTRHQGDGGAGVLMVSSSRDGGVTFADPEFIPLDSGSLHSITDLAVLRDGTVLMPFLVDYAQIPGDEVLYRGHRWVLISAKGSGSWEGPFSVADNLQFGNENWERAMKGLGGGDLAIDGSGGAYDGTIYMTWPAVIHGHLQIALARSGDGGRTWTDPVVVNDGGFDADHGTPTVAVNGEGVVLVTWNDRRDDRRGLCFRHYAGASMDGGRTFGPSRPVSGRSTCPGERSRWLNGGDTQGLVALPDGSFRTVWSVGREDDLRPWTAVIRVRQ